jgi:hypothetical protein
MLTCTYTIPTIVAPVLLQHSHAVLPAYSTPEHPTPTCHAGTGLAGILGAPSGSVSPPAAAAASQPAATDAAAPTDQPDAQQQQQQPMRILDGPTTNPEPPPEGLSPPMARDMDSAMDSEAGEGTLHPALYALPSELRDPPPGADTAVGYTGGGGVTLTLWRGGGEGLSLPVARDTDSAIDSEAGEGTLHPALYALPSELRDPPPGADTAVVAAQAGEPCADPVYNRHARAIRPVTMHVSVGTILVCCTVQDMIGLQHSRPTENRHRCVELSAGLATFKDPAAGSELRGRSLQL